MTTQPQSVVIGGEPETVYRRGDEIVVSGHLRCYVDEAIPLAIALRKAATDD